MSKSADDRDLLSNGMKKNLEWGILGTLFLVPFIPFLVTGSMYFPFITGKAFAFRILVGIGLALWCALLFFDRSYVPKKSPMLWAVLAFFGVVAVADIFGANFERSLWSNFERMEGLVTFLYLCAFFLVSSTVLTRKNLWSAFWNTSIAASVVMAFYALAQAFGVSDPSQAGVRVDGTMGNAIYLAVYMLFHMFLTLWFLYRKHSSKGPAVFYITALILQFAALYNTGTRGTMLGLLGGLGLTALLIAWRGGAHPRLRKISLGVILALVALVAVFTAFKDSSFVQERPILSRFANISIYTDSGEARFILWNGVALPGFYERPILGWGQDNFIVVFGKYYDPRMYQQEPWYDRAHNVFLDWLIAAGVVGLLAYLSLFGVALYILWRKSAQLSVPERSLGTGLLAGYFVHNLFVFDNLISYIFFFLFLGFIASTYVRLGGEASAVAQNTRQQNDGVFADSSLRNTIVGGVLLLILVLVYMTTIPHIRASKNIIGAVLALQKGSLTEPLEMFNDAIADPVADDEARYQLNRLAFTVAATDNPTVTNEVKRQYLERTLAELEQGVAEDPLNTRPKYFLAVFHARTGNLVESERLFAELFEVNPHRQIFLAEYGVVLELLGKKTESEDIFKRYWESAPESADAATRYVASLFLHGKRADAETVLMQFSEGLLGDRPVSLALYKTPVSYTEASRITAFEVERVQLRRINATKDEYLIGIRDLANAGRKTEALVLTDDLAAFVPEYAQQATELKAAVQSGREIQIQGPGTSTSGELQ
ncbi:MAG: hypothetical protein AMXMBFR44_1100 [Candidatus Campbellbacteria bacterium]